MVSERLRNLGLDGQDAGQTPQALALTEERGQGAPHLRRHPVSRETSPRATRRYALVGRTDSLPVW